MSDFDERDLLTRELRDRSADVGGHPIGFDAVRHSARRIHRRRQVVSGAVAAAVLSVAVPTGLAVTGGLSGGDGPVKRPPVASSPSVSPRPAGDLPLTLGGLPRGADPRIDYLRGNALVLADGRVVELEKEYKEIAPLETGWVGLAEEEGNYSRDYIDPDGSVTDSLPSTWGLATDLDGSHVAFTQVEDGRLNIFDVTTDGMEPRSPRNDANRQVRPVGYVGEDVLVYEVEQTEADPGEVRVFEPSADDYEIPADPKLMGAGGTSQAEGLVSGMTRSMVDGSCWAVVDYQTGEQAFETCDHSLGRFSRDGRYVIGSDAYGDGAGPRGLAVLDAESGEVVVDFQQKRDGRLTFGEMVWEDDEHVLAPVIDGLESKIVRFGLDGSIEAASGTVKVPDYDLPSPIRFSAQP